MTDLIFATFYVIVGVVALGLFTFYAWNPERFREKPADRTGRWLIPALTFLNGMNIVLGIGWFAGGMTGDPGFWGGPELAGGIVALGIYYVVRARSPHGKK